jgi:Holliday junction resolvase RusA-like endonuclease
VIETLKITIRGVTPEPWTAGTAFRRGPRGVGIAKNAALVAYQEAVKEALREQFTGEPITDDIVLDVWFWRQLATYEGPSGRMVTKHRCDLSNMVKAFEDACQGILFKNDNQVVRNSACIVGQSKDIESMIIVRISDPSVDLARAKL